MSLEPVRFQPFSDPRPILDQAIARLRGEPLQMPASLESVDPAGVTFDLDARHTSISNEHTRSKRTSWDADGELSINTPQGTTTGVAITYHANLPEAMATPAAMRHLNPFDPATIPPNSTISLNGSDYVGTPFEAGFRSLASANDTDIAGLRLVLATDRDGELRVMSGPAAIYDAPRDHGPASQPLDREDFTQHTTLLDDPAHSTQRTALNAMFLTGKVPEHTTVIREDAGKGKVDARITDSGSGETNDVTWEFDSKGRPVHAEATLTWEPSSAGRDSDAIEVKAQSDFRKDNNMSGTGDDVGHIFAYRFVNGHGPINMFPQDGNLNRVVYTRMEQEWSDWLGMGMEVRIDTTLAPKNVDRPDQVQVDYEVIDPTSGKVVYDPSVFNFANTTGQTFDPIARNDMDDMIGTANA